MSETASLSSNIFRKTIYLSFMHCLDHLFDDTWKISETLFYLERSLPYCKSGEQIMPKTNNVYDPLCFFSVAARFLFIIFHFHLPLVCAKLNSTIGWGKFSKAKKGRVEPAIRSFVENKGFWLVNMRNVNKRSAWALQNFRRPKLGSSFCVFICDRSSNSPVK